MIALKHRNCIQYTFMDGVTNTIQFKWLKGGFTPWKNYAPLDKRGVLQTDFALSDFVLQFFGHF